MEETKQSLHQELSLLQNQLDSVNQENSNIQGKLQIGFFSIFKVL